MSDMNQLPQTVDSVSKFGTKFLEVVDTALNNSPFAIKRRAKAKAEEIRLITEAIKANPDLPIKYTDGEISIDGSACDEILARSQKRIACQSLKEQVNIENIVEAAYSQIENKEEAVSSNTLDEDWVTRFFKYAGDISNEEMQTLWGAILSGEVKQPGSFSLRTLEILRNMSQKEARIFHKVSSLATLNFSDRYHYIYSNYEILEKFGVDFLDILTLSDIGLLSQNLNLTLKSDIESSPFAKYNIWAIFLKSETLKTINIPITKYTTVGEELFSINKPKYYNIDYIKEIAKDLSKQKVSLSFAELITDADEAGNITYKPPIVHL